MCLGFWGLGFLFKGFECLWFFHFFFPFVFVLLSEKNSLILKVEKKKKKTLL